MPALEPSLEIVRVPALRDNYIWLLHDRISQETIVVDPAEGEPALDAARARGWTITQIWNTHWHPDHVGGNQAIRDATGARVTAPAAEAAKIGHIDRSVGEGDQVSTGTLKADVWEVPAHTAGHIAYHLPDVGAIFVGDTLFAMGCGRLFEGSPAQMYAAMRRFEALPDATNVYCAHEYTLSNARYAAHAEPENSAVAERLKAVEAARAADQATVPTTIGAERATNPFLRADSVAELARRRAEKDSF
ncbi:MAG TPA: hydroxyacylglutathione hydrolase [Sphingobium sp.]|uniref:hydroxyacylglutathione hydrolase n=1 Tax=Sphingobium sp. TaxID=1912891 RepID=UPI002ED2B875